MPKLIYTVILWYRFVVQSPPPPRGGGLLLHDSPPPPPLRGNRPDKRGEIARGGGYSIGCTVVPLSRHALHLWAVAYVPLNAAVLDLRPLVGFQTPWMFALVLNHTTGECGRRSAMLCCLPALRRGFQNEDPDRNLGRR